MPILALSTHPVAAAGTRTDGQPVGQGVDGSDLIQSSGSKPMEIFHFGLRLSFD
jgi:hypothetical protein